VRCRLFHSDLDSKPVYDGVSYFWGNRKTAYLRINGLLREVPAGLVSDLRRLRTSGGGRSRILFVDALSFDWSHPEKAEHPERVRLTPQIFKQAQQVAIGLGDRDDADASAIEFVTRAASMSHPERETVESTTQWSRDPHEG
jgi:hypothetical protein